MISRIKISSVLVGLSLISIGFILPLYVKLYGLFVIILTLSFLLEKNIKSRIQTQELKIALPFFLLFILYISSLLYTEDLKNGYRDIEQKLSLLLIPFLLLTTRLITKNLINGVFVSFLSSCFLVVTACLIDATMLSIDNLAEQKSFENLMEIFGHHFTYTELSSTFFFHLQPIYLSLYISFAIIICVWHSFQNKPSPKIKIALFTLSIYFFIITILLNSRTQTITLLIVLFGIFIYYIIIKHKNFVLGLSIISLTLIVSFLFITISPKNKERFVQILEIKKEYESGSQAKLSNGTVRIYKWINTFELIKENFIFGVGPGDLQEELVKKYEKNGFLEGIRVRYNPHNQFLSIWAGLGLIGFCAYILCLIVSFKQAIKYKNVLHISFLSLFILSTLTESMLERIYGISFFVFFNFILIKFNFISSTKNQQINGSFGDKIFSDEENIRVK